jgi:translation initiation factor IF-2
MKIYPISLELTVWFDLGINQYEITIDEKSSLSVKRTDDVFHARDLMPAEVSELIDAIQAVDVPVLKLADTDSEKASSSYELIIESAHFSLEFNWENLDIAADTAGSLDSVSRLTQLVEKIGQFN